MSGQQVRSAIFCKRESSIRSQLGDTEEPPSSTRDVNTLKELDTDTTKIRRFKMLKRIQDLSTNTPEKNALIWFRDTLRPTIHEQVHLSEPLLRELLGAVKNVMCLMLKDSALVGR